MGLTHSTGHTIRDAGTKSACGLIQPHPGRVEGKLLHPGTTIRLRDLANPSAATARPGAAHSRRDEDGGYGNDSFVLRCRTRPCRDGVRRAAHLGTVDMATDVETCPPNSRTVIHAEEADVNGEEGTGVAAEWRRVEGMTGGMEMSAAEAGTANAACSATGGFGENDGAVCSFEGNGKASDEGDDGGYKGNEGETKSDSEAENRTYSKERVDHERLPDIVIIVDQQEEYTALRECITLGIPTICLIDTNCDPDLADISISANDDAIASIRLILNKLVFAICEGRSSYIRTKFVNFSI
ncbi:hypothetical protein Ahy_B04g073559 [Arachis hypogaea]|uniref:Small ribosomal subunit protein uS2c n=1 Tax=Arachis hypogaea TaxID=3818 RepID=A0A444ZQU5_ARAHY|nr:hypothetical protein Ahy_B04g073559 [Arachis hypogaea]